MGKLSPEFPQTRFDMMKQSPVEVAQSLQQDIKVSEKGKRTGILKLIYDSPDPAMAVKVVDAIARTYLRQNVERKSEDAQQALAFLQQQLPQVKEHMDVAEGALNAYRLKRGSIDLSLETRAVLDQSVMLEQQISELQMKYAELRRRFTENNPLMQGLNDKISRLQGKKQRFERKVKKLPETEQEILRLARDVKVNAELYTFLLNKVQELKVVKAGTIGNVRILDFAVMPNYPVEPRKSRILLLGLLLGLFVGVLLAFLRKSMQKGIESPDVIEQKLGIPVYATVPHAEAQSQLHEKMRKSKGKDGDFLLASVADSNLAVESLRTNLHFGLMDAKNNVVMISGPSPEVGKSFVSANLAHVLAQGGKRVLLIDADLRKGHLHEYFGLARTPGLSEGVCGDISLVQAVSRTSYEGLDVLTTGCLPPNPSELLMSDHFETMLTEASKNYDLILIDTPPVLAVTDAVVIGKLAGTAFLLLRAGRHPIQEIQQAVRHLEQGGVKLQGTIFNGLQPKRSKYGYGYGYGYGGYQYEYKKNENRQ
jgi:tyrosine-protein kinase Etk/Wzc